MYPNKTSDGELTAAAVVQKWNDQVNEYISDEKMTVRSFFLRFDRQGDGILPGLFHALSPGLHMLTLLTHSHLHTHTHTQPIALPSLLYPRAVVADVERAISQSKKINMTRDEIKVLSCRFRERGKRTNMLHSLPPGFLLSRTQPSLCLVTASRSHLGF